MPTRQATEMAPTRFIGMSCSTRSSVWPPLRRDCAAKAEVRPPTRGPASFISVQMAATPITPAPMKRTSRAQTVPASSSAGASAGRVVAIEGMPLAVSQAMVSGEVRIGTAMHHARIRPNSWAKPTVRPIRWPAPSRANCMPKPTPVAPPPRAAGSLMKRAASAANSRAATPIA